MKTTILLLAASLLPAAQGVAGTIDIFLNSPTVNLTPGGTALLTATLQNNSASTVDLNNLSINLAGLFSTDITPFFSGAATIGPNSQLLNYPLFQISVLVPYSDPYGPQTGSVTMLGGEEGAGGYDSSTLDILGSANFTVDVQPAAGVPEPGTLSFVLAGVAGILIFRTQRRSSSK